jgi:hypothetical protein
MPPLISLGSGPVVTIDGVVSGIIGDTNTALAAATNTAAIKSAMAVRNAAGKFIRT